MTTSTHRVSAASCLLLRINLLRERRGSVCPKPPAFSGSSRKIGGSHIHTLDSPQALLSRKPPVSLVRHSTTIKSGERNSITYGKIITYFNQIKMRHRLAVVPAHILPILGLPPRREGRSCVERWRTYDDGRRVFKPRPNNKITDDGSCQRRRRRRYPLPIINPYMKRCSAVTVCLTIRPEMVFIN